MGTNYLLFLFRNRTVHDHEMRQDFQYTNYLPFPHRNRRPQEIDRHFGKFMEVIQKLFINIPLLDAIQVPAYAKYIRDILNKKRLLTVLKYQI